MLVAGELGPQGGVEGLGELSFELIRRQLTTCPSQLGQGLRGTDESRSVDDKNKGKIGDGHIQHKLRKKFKLEKWWRERERI